MKSYTNSKLKRKLQNKGIQLDERKKKIFDKYSYYQVVNAYKNIFSKTIENIDDIEKNILSGNDIERYKKNYGISHFQNEKHLIRQVKSKICEKYGITNKYSDSDEELTKKIKSIQYYNHLYSDKVFYSDFVRMYKFEHELRNVLLKYTLIIEESLKNVFVVYLNSIEANADFLTDINQYETGQNNISNAIESIKKVFDKQTNKYSNPIKRKNKQNLSVPYWIIINELTLGETVRLVINLKTDHRTKILENCINYFTNMNLKFNLTTDEEEMKYYYNHINVMRELL
ncbi:MAG: Abi family protein, partial [Bacilli bacterium]|nr:Abi family protein [Bacilli bacterium]